MSDRSPWRTRRFWRVLNVARAELRAPAPVTWRLTSPGAPGTRFAGQSVLVTGAAGLIGSALVEGFLAEGATVLAVDVDSDRLVQLHQRIAASPNGPTAAQRLVTSHTDLESDSDLAALGESIEAVDVLVHCAGFNDYVTDVESLTRVSWHRVLDINVVGPALLTGLVTRHLDAANGSIVFITSINGLASSKWPPYGAAKAALTKLVDDLARQLAPRGIRVNAVAPGWVTDATDPDDLRIAPYQPLGGSSVPVEAIVHAVMFLADASRSPMTTGQHLTVDGSALLQRTDR